MLLAPALFLFALCEAYRQQSLIWLIGGLIAISGGFASWLHGKKTELSVSHTELVARGNVGRIFYDEIRVSTSTITFLGYDNGGEDEPSGLYARHKFGSTCILDGVNEEMSNKIATAVFLRFPEIGSGDGDPGSFLFGGRDEPISLNLSKQK